MSLYTNGNLAVDYKTQEQRNRRTDKKVKSNSMSGREKLFYLFSLMCIIAIAGVVISGYASITKLNYEVQEVKKSVNSLTQENESLEMQIVELSTPERIIQYAKENLGMSVDEDKIIVLSNNN